MLGDKDVVATIAVGDIAVAAEFYEGTLGLRRAEYQSPDPTAILYRSGNAALLVYQSQYAGTNRATSASWGVGDDFEAIVAKLGEKGVAVRALRRPAGHDPRGRRPHDGAAEGRVVQGPGREHPQPRQPVALSGPDPSIPFPPMEARARPRAARGRRVAVRAEVGRLPRRARERRRRARALVAQRAAAAALLPGAAAARRAAAAAFGARRRDRDRRRRRARLRRDADAAPPGRVADPEAVGGDPGASTSSSTCCSGTASRCGSCRSRSGGAGSRRCRGFRLSPATRDVGDARGWLDAVRGARPRRRGREASRRRRTCRARATASSR